MTPYTSPMDSMAGRIKELEGQLELAKAPKKTPNWKVILKGWWDAFLYWKEWSVGFDLAVIFGIIGLLAGAAYIACHEGPINCFYVKSSSSEIPWYGSKHHILGSRTGEDWVDKTIYWDYETAHDFLVKNHAKICGE